ncbi:MAG: hypothetical protein M1827_007121 [Pycnora praestabilis]|nr:MAG: hypothetical protein M1827_007121 [Pycnora praestabilis]
MPCKKAARAMARRRHYSQQPSSDSFVSLDQTQDSVDHCIGSKAMLAPDPGLIRQEIKSTPCAGKCPSSIETSSVEDPQSKFQHWVRRHRNQSASWMERFTCPMLWCRDHFDDEEHMLDHVTQCSQLSSGEYWCPEHQAAERFTTVADIQLHPTMPYRTRLQKLNNMMHETATLTKNAFRRLGPGASRRSDVTPYQSYAFSFNARNSDRTYELDAKLQEVQGGELEAQSIFELSASTPSELPTTPYRFELESQDQFPDSYAQSSPKGFDCARNTVAPLVAGEETTILHNSIATSLLRTSPVDDQGSDSSMSPVSPLPPIFGCSNDQGFPGLNHAAFSIIERSFSPVSPIDADEDFLPITDDLDDCSSKHVYCKSGQGVIAQAGTGPAILSHHSPRSDYQLIAPRHRRGETKPELVRVATQRMFASVDAFHVSSPSLCDTLVYVVSWHPFLLEISSAPLSPDVFTNTGHLPIAIPAPVTGFYSVSTRRNIASLPNSDQDITQSSRHLVGVSCSSLATGSLTATEEKYENLSGESSLASLINYIKIVIIEPLALAHGLEVFLPAVMHTERRLEAGFLSSIREVENELIKAAQESRQKSESLFASFSQGVAHVCSISSAWLDGYFMRRKNPSQKDLTLTRNPFQSSPDTEREEGQAEKTLTVDTLNGVAHDSTTVNRGRDDGVATSVSLARADSGYITGSPLEYSSPSSPSDTSSMETSSPYIKRRHYSIIGERPDNFEIASADEQFMPATLPKPQLGGKTSVAVLDPLPCPTCHVATFKGRWRKGALKKHLNTVHAKDQERFNCPAPGCLSSFGRVDNLRTHLQKAHSGLSDFDSGFPSRRRKRKHEEEDDDDDQRVEPAGL